MNCVNGSTTVWSQIFSYDAFGNLSKNGTQSFQPVYNPATNQMTSIGNQPPTYDADGRVTNDFLNTYSWDTYGRPTMVDGAGVTYDALGRMVEMNYPSEIFYTPAGDRILFKAQLARRAVLDLPGGARVQYDESQNQSGGGLLYYEHRDFLGSGRLLSTPSRTYSVSTAYAPFGELYAQNTTTGGDFTGTSQNFNFTEYEFPARVYGTQGRWPSPDPAGLAAVNPMDPQTWNRYAYVRNSPLKLIDPLGLQQQQCKVDSNGCLGLVGNGDDGSASASYAVGAGGGGDPCFNSGFGTPFGQSWQDSGGDISPCQSGTTTGASGQASTAAGGGGAVGNLPTSTSPIAPPVASVQLQPAQTQQQNYNSCMASFQSTAVGKTVQFGSLLSFFDNAWSATKEWTAAFAVKGSYLKIAETAGQSLQPAGEITPVTAVAKPLVGRAATGGVLLATWADVEARWTCGNIAAGGAPPVIGPSFIP